MSQGEPGPKYDSEWFTRESKAVYGRLTKLDTCWDCEQGPFLEYPKGHLERWRKGEGRLADGSVCPGCKGSGWTYYGTNRPYLEDHDPA